jgi:hypothetical protein
MKTVKINPFEVFKVTDELLESVEKNLNQKLEPKQSSAELVKRIRRTGSGHFVAIHPKKKEQFSFIPIITEDHLFTSPFPDPIQLLYSHAFESYQSSIKLKKNIGLQKSPDTPITFINDYLYNWFLKYKISTLIFLQLTVEAFINYLMPEDFIYRQEIDGTKSDKFKKQTREYTKEQTERFILFKDKLKGVIPQLTKIDFEKEYKKTYDTLINLNSIRNEIVHLRSHKSGNLRHFHKVFDKVIFLNLSPYVTAVKDFINIIKPNFILFEESKPKNDNQKSIINLQHDGFFISDFSLLLNIFKAPTQRVDIIIPKSNNKNFQISVNWIYQNIDMLAKEKLIYFPNIRTRFKNKIIIEVTKTGNDLLTHSQNNK